MMNKRGSEIVEAAIVLPIFILIVLSLIGACVFQFTALKEECNAQKEVIETIREEKALMKRVERAVTSSSYVGGLYRGALTKSYDAYGYAINEAKILRAGNEILGSK